VSFILTRLNLFHGANNGFSQPFRQQDIFQRVLPKETRWGCWEGKDNSV